MLSIKKPMPPSNFMQKRVNPIVTGFMQKGHGGILRGVTLQPNPEMTAPQRKNTLERQ